MNRKILNDLWLEHGGIVDQFRKNVEAKKKAFIKAGICDENLNYIPIPKDIMDSIFE